MGRGGTDGAAGNGRAAWPANGGETNLGAAILGMTTLGAAATGLDVPADLDCMEIVGTIVFTVGAMTFGAVTFGATMMGLGAKVLGGTSSGPSAFIWTKAAATAALVPGISLVIRAIFCASSRILKFAGVRPPRSSSKPWAYVQVEPRVHRPLSQKRQYTVLKSGD